MIKAYTIWESRSPDFAYSYLGDGGITTLSARPCFFKGKRHILLTRQDDTCIETRLSSCPVEPKNIDSWSDLFEAADFLGVDLLTDEEYEQ